MKISEKIFDTFKWIDIENPNIEDLQKIKKEHGINFYLIKDSLTVGHLPKYEKNNNIDFYIFRAYTSDIKLKTDIRDYNKGLAEVLAMKPRIYKRKDNLEVDSDKVTGF